MKSRGYAVTYAGESQDYNKENYFLNGICKEDLESLSCCTMNKDVRSRNMYAVSSAVNSSVAGVDLAYIAVDVLKGFFGSDFKIDNNEYFNIANNAITSHVFESGNSKFDVDSSIVYLDKNVATVYNIGDAPVFFFENGKLERLSGQVPSSIEVQKTFYDDYGNLKIRMVEKPTAKHLGVMDDSREVVPFVSRSISLKNNCAFVLCSEALADTVGQDVIKKILADKNIKEADKAVQIVNRAVEIDPEGNYTIVVVEVTKGIPIALAELKSLYRWSAIAVACLFFCMFGTNIATGVGNFIKSVQSVFDYYSIGEKDEADAPLYVPEKNADEQQSDAKAEEQTPVQNETTPETQAEQQPANNSLPNTQPTTQQRPQTTPAPSNQGAVTVQQPANSNQADSSAKTETPAVAEPQSDSNKKPGKELPIDFN